MNAGPLPAPFAVPNIRLFVIFRVLFGARFYYPVFAILFLDYGLTLAQFALLNTIWAVTIVCLEVPSGAIADLLGRKRMVVLASLLMIAELLVIALVPIGNPTLVFGAFLLNRLLSGAAEACASGADEALAYDSLAAAGRKDDWPHVLALEMRWRAIAMMAAMIIGAAVYDPGLIQRVTGLELAQTTTVRFPIWLTALSAVGALCVALRLREPAPIQPAVVSAGATLRQTLRAGRWILDTPRALAIIAVALSFDSITRLFLTLDSQYLRLIAIPDAAFGVINAALAGIAYAVPPLARWLVKSRSPAANFWLLAALIFVGLVGLAQVWPWWGLIWVVPTVTGFYLVGFFASHYLNEITDSSQRATVLSFRSLAQNLAYGTINLAFGVLMARLGRGLEFPAEALADALRWLPGYFAVVVIALALFGRRATRGWR